MEFIIVNFVEKNWQKKSKGVNMAKHTMADLYQMQAMPLKIKLRMTQSRIRGWVDEYGEDGVYVSFSGGKDSTVLLDITRKLYPDTLAVFVDTRLEYPEIRQFVKTYDNVKWLKPKNTFKEVIEKFGYPFISKEISDKVYGARKYLEKLVVGGQTSLFSVHGRLVRNRQKNQQEQHRLSELKKGDFL